MNRLLIVALATTLGMVQSVYGRTVEIDVHGMTCVFCVDSLERKFGNMESVSKVEVSLKQKKVRLVTDETLPSIETIKQTVVDAGFTPVKITVKADEKQ
jgi:copper chaperone CopZ